MDSLKLLPVFHVFLWLPAALALVEQPTNVTLQCHNMQNILKWSYQQLLPGLRFRVDIQPYVGSAEVMWVEPPALEADVSILSDPDNEYLVKVTAVIGQNKSESAPPHGITFSYFMDSYVSQKCFLDLPSVNITALPDDKIAFSFTHPWLFYYPLMPSSQISRPKRRRYHTQSELPAFKYGVVIVSQKHSHHFSCVKSVCEQEIPVEPAQKKHCLNITGETQKMAVTATQLYCVMPFSEPPLEQNNFVIYIVVSLLIVAVAAFILFLLYKKMTSPGNALPKSITINRTTQNSTVAVEEKISVTKVEPSSPTPLLSHHYDSDVTPADPPFTDDMPIGVLTNDKGMCEDTEAEEVDDGGQGYRGGGNLDEAETQSCSEVPSGYEKRDELVELGPNDSAKGYRA